jgi:hypothetical protein
MRVELEQQPEAHRDARQDDRGDGEEPADRVGRRRPLGPRLVERRHERTAVRV